MMSHKEKKDSHVSSEFSFAALTISDRCSKGLSVDESGPAIIGMVCGIGGKKRGYDIVPDDIEQIKEKLVFYCDRLKVDVVLTTGGTGLGPRDVTPEATMQIADKLIPGIPELMRREGLKKTKNAVLSRAVSVMRGRVIIVNLPGSPKGVRESLSAILDLIPHALAMAKGEGHGV